MKPLLALLLIPTSVFAFSDVPLQSPYEQAINYMRDQNIVQGYVDGTFRADIPINRAEFTKIVIEATMEVGNDTNCFSDVKDEWFARYVCTAKTKNIISGYPDGSFQPEKNITFVEAAKIIAGAFTMESPETESSDWYASYVAALQTRNAIPLQIRELSHTITRGEMAEMIFRIHAKQSEKPSRTFVSLQQSSTASTARSSSSMASAPQNSFATFPVRLSVQPDWDTKWNIVPIEATKESMANVKVESEEGGTFPQFLRVLFPKGTASRFVWKFYEKPLGGLYAWVNPNIEPQDELYLRYFIRVPEDFVYEKGGSLPGMFTGIQNGRNEESTASVNLGWDSKGIIYVAGNFQNKVGAHANYFPTKTLLPRDNQWHTIDLHARLETQPGKSNGMIQYWFDGEELLHAESVLFPNRSGDRWDALALSTILGTTDATSLSSQDSHIDLGGFIFSDKPIQ